jgi:prepilin-type N-terminal cleavage/methylation domain-containing protein
MKMTAPSHRRAGMTLVEIMITSAIMGILSIVLMKGFISGLNIYYYETGKILINKDIRKFTSEMTENATYSNFFIIYPSYTSLTRTSPTLVNPADPDQGYTTAISSNQVADGQSGDCLVLAYKDPTNDRLISRLMIYFRSPDATGVGPVRRVDWPITPSSSANIYDLIPPIPDPTIYPVVVQLSVGLANGKLFYDFRDKAIIIKGQIIHQGGMINSAISTATNTYNFTVSPRG